MDETPDNEIQEDNIDELEEPQPIERSKRKPIPKDKKREYEKRYRDKKKAEIQQIKEQVQSIPKVEPLIQVPKVEQKVETVQKAKPIPIPKVEKPVQEYVSREKYKKLKGMLYNVAHEIVDLKKGSSQKYRQDVYDKLFKGF